MAKFVILLLILFGASLYFPQTRPVVFDTISPVLNPVLIWQTKGEMDRIGRELETLHREGDDLPAPGERFQNWMGKNFMGGAKTDAWKNSYTLRVTRDSIFILSAGPDMEIDTGDDLSFGFAALAPRGNR